MENCFECKWCKRNGKRNTEVAEYAAYCDCQDIPNDFPFAEYHRPSIWTACLFHSKTNEILNSYPVKYLV